MKFNDGRRSVYRHLTFRDYASFRFGLLRRPLATDQFGSSDLDGRVLDTRPAIRCRRLAVLSLSIGGSSSISCRRFSFSS